MTTKFCVGGCDSEWPWVLMVFMGWPLAYVFFSFFFRFRFHKTIYAIVDSVWVVRAFRMERIHYECYALKLKTTCLNKVYAIAVCSLVCVLH